jgi:hypothetical protein
MRGMPYERCKCVYDNPDRTLKRKQGILNSRLDIAWRKFRDDRLKRRFDEERAAKKEGRVRSPTPPSVDVFNDELFLLPKGRSSTSRA